MKIKIKGSFVENKVYFKKLTMRYAEVFKKLFNDPFITKYISIPYPIKTSWIKEYITDAMSKYEKKEKFTWAVFSSYDHSMIGVVVIKDIDYKNKSAKIGYSIGKSYWNKGYTLMAVKLLLKFAFLKLFLNRIEIRIDCHDDKSLKLLEELGAVKEGVMRKAIIYNDRYRDVCLYSILKDEYIETPKAQLYQKTLFPEYSINPVNKLI